MISCMMSRCHACAWHAQVAQSIDSNGTEGVNVTLALVASAPLRDVLDVSNPLPCSVQLCLPSSAEQSVLWGCYRAATVFHVTDASLLWTLCMQAFEAIFACNCSMTAGSLPFPMAFALRGITLTSFRLVGVQEAPAGPSQAMLLSMEWHALCRAAHAKTPPSPCHATRGCARTQMRA